MVDELHGRPRGTARRNFNANRKHFIKDRDFFEVPYEEYGQLFERTNFVRSKTIDGTNFVPSKGGSRVGMIFLTETGYLMVVKSLTDDKAWEVHRALVEFYFNSRKPAPPLTAEEKDFIREWIAAGESINSVARRLGRARSSVWKYSVERAATQQIQLLQ